MMTVTISERAEAFLARRGRVLTWVLYGLRAEPSKVMAIILSSRSIVIIITCVILTQSMIFS